MEIMRGSRKRYYLAIASVFLITAALIVGMVGCDGGGYLTLTITSTEGGSVTTPGEGTFTYDEGTLVEIVAEPEESYLFIDWTGDVDTIANVDGATTTINVTRDYYIRANFAYTIEIRDWYGLNATRNNPATNYILMTDIDSTTPGYEELASPTADIGRGWQPIGDFNNPFEGIFDGQGYEIRDLFINRPNECDVGLFKHIGERGSIKNISLVDTTVTGNMFVGSLVGYNENGTVSKSYFTGSVTGKAGVGGLVGLNECWAEYPNKSNVSGSYSSGNVTGEGVVGGLVGVNFHAAVSDSYSSGNVTGEGAVGGLMGGNSGTVSNSYSTASVNGGSGVGGLIGENDDGTLSNSYSTGSVIGEDAVGGLVGMNDEGAAVSNSYSASSVNGVRWVGGLVGVNFYGAVNYSYSIGSVTGENAVGGLVGWNDRGTVSDSYATGTVIGEWIYIGGLVGKNYGTVNKSYSTGSVSGNESVGGLVGVNEGGTVSNSFWDTQTSGQSTSDGGTGKTTTQMNNIATFSGAAWNIIAVGGPGARNPAYIWNIVNYETYPFLSWQP